MWPAGAHLDDLHVRCVPLDSRRLRSSTFESDAYINSPLGGKRYCASLSDRPGHKSVQPEHGYRSCEWLDATAYETLVDSVRQQCNLRCVSSPRCWEPFIDLNAARHRYAGGAACRWPRSGLGLRTADFTMINAIRATQSAGDGQNSKSWHTDTLSSRQTATTCLS